MMKSRYLRQTRISSPSLFSLSIKNLKSLFSIYCEIMKIFTFQVDRGPERIGQRWIQPLWGESAQIFRTWDKKDIQVLRLKHIQVSIFSTLDIFWFHQPERSHAASRKLFEASSPHLGGFLYQGFFSKIFFTVLCDGFDQRGVAFTIAQATTWGKKRIRIRIWIRIWIWILIWIWIWL